MTIVLKLLFAFLFGGGVCLIAQILIDKTDLTPARILVLYVVVGVLLGAVGIYDILLPAVGAGVTVPLLGFGGTVARGVREAIDRDGAIGILTGPLTAASAGTTAAIVFGYLVALIFRAKPKTQ